MILFRKFYVFIIPFLVSACVPNATTYYRPTVEGGEIVLGKCVPTESTSKFKVGELQVSVSITASGKKDKLSVGLVLNPTLNQNLQFDSDKIIVRDLINGTELQPDSIYVSRVDQINSITVPFPAPDTVISPLGFNYTVYISIKKTDIFEIQIPPILINSKVHKFPLIHFKKKIWAGISPFNC